MFSGVLVIYFTNKQILHMATPNNVNIYWSAQIWILSSFSGIYLILAIFLMDEALIQ